jgi:hypothetical protein
MPLAGLKPANPASERPQTHVLDRAATGIGRVIMSYFDAALSSFEYALSNDGIVSSEAASSRMAAGVKWF